MKKHIVSGLFLRGHIAGLGLVAVAAAALSCAGEAPRRWSSAQERFQPGDATFAAQFPRLDKLRDEFLTLIVNANGVEGLLDLVRTATGLDLAAEDLFERSGLDPAFAPLLFEYRGAGALVLGLSDPPRFVEFAAGTGKATAVEFREIPTDGPTLYTSSDGLAWAVDGNLAVLLKGQPDSAVGTLAALLLEPPPESASRAHHAGDSGDAGAAKVGTGEDGAGDEGTAGSAGTAGDAIRFRWQLGREKLGDRETLEGLGSLGPAAGLGHVLLGFLDSCTAVEGTIAPGDRYLFEVSLAGCAFAAAGQGTLAPETMLPEDTILLLHWTTGAATLLDLFSGVQQALLEMAWKELGVPKALSDVRGVLRLFRGETAVAFLGLSPSASVTTFTAPADPLDPLLALHLAVILPLTTGAVLPDLHAVPVDAKTTPDKSADPVEPFRGFKSTLIGEGTTLDGREYCRESKDSRSCFSILQLPDRLVLVTGAGEGPRVAHILQGKGKALDQALFNTQQRGALTVTLKTRKLVRDLTAHGFPPYFLQVLSSILEMRMAADPAAGGARISLEVVLR